jgi:tetratricopeptide (TPR) repeat protein
MRSCPWWPVAVLLAGSCLIGCSHNLLKQAQQYELAGKNASALLTYQEALASTPERNQHQRSEIRTRMGVCLFNMDRLAESFDAFQKAAEGDPNNTLAHLRLGELLLSAGSTDAAREQAMLVLHSMSRNNEALALLGASWAAADNPTMAKAAYEQVLQSDPKRVKVSIALADIYNREENPQKAREILEQAADVQPGNAQPWLAIARLEEQEANGRQAEAAYRHAISVEDTPETNFRLAQFLQRAARVTEAEQALRRVDAQSHNYPVALGDFQFLSGRPGDALEQYRAALEATSVAPVRRHFWQSAKFDSGQDSNSKNRATVAARTIEAALSATNQQRGKERTASLAAIRKRLDNFRPILDRATAAVLESELALADNNVTMAQLSANAAMELAPESAAAHYVNGLVESSVGNRENANKEWQAALDNDGHYTPAHLALAEAALEGRDGKEADEHARGVVRDDPGNFHALVVFARALLLEGKPTLAAIMAQRAAALDPSSAEPSILIGEISLKIDHPAEALLAFERAVAVHPDSEEAIDGLLSVYRRGRVSYASLKKMENAAQTPPASSTLLEITGRLYADRGWYTEAIRALTEAVQADPNRTTAARVLAHLQLVTGDFAQASKVASQTVSLQQPLLDGYRADASGDWKQAIAGYERSVREGDRTGVAANNLAWLYAEHNSQLDRALSLAESAVKYSPNDPSVLDTLGYVYLQRHEYSSAVKVLETAARLSAANNSASAREVGEQIRKHLSDAYFRSGQTTAAAQIAQNHRPITMK